MAYAATAIISRKEEKKIRNSRSHEIRPRGASPSVVNVALGLRGSVTIASEGEGKQRFLFHVVSLRRARGRALTRGPSYRQHRPLARQVAKPRQHVIQRAHVGRLFLHPHDLACVRMTLELGCELCFRKWIELIDERDGYTGGLFPGSFQAKLVPNFPTAKQDAAGIRDLPIGSYALESAGREFLDWRRRIAMARHTLLGQYHHRLPPR